MGSFEGKSVPRSSPAATPERRAADSPGGGGLGVGGTGGRWRRRQQQQRQVLGVARMTRGKQKMEAQKRSAERNEKPKGSQIEARNAGLKTVCSVCKAPLANYKQLVDHYGSKHPKETVPPGPSS